MKKTTIQINKSTLERLKSLKQFNKQSYDDVLVNLIQNDEVEVLTEEDIREIQEGLDDVKNGRVYSAEQVAKELGLKIR